MHVLVYGTGAVGGYFGARLATGGHDVTLVARGANLAALRADGLRVHLAPTNETLHVHPIRAVERPADAPPADLVLVCVKSYDTIAAADALRPVVRPDTMALSLQNGVENETIIAERLGLPPLMVGLTRIGVELTAPGTVSTAAAARSSSGSRTGPRARARAGSPTRSPRPASRISSGATSS
jgi:2-dehydropantoate 2-reductase